MITDKELRELLKEPLKLNLKEPSNVTTLIKVIRRIVNSQISLNRNTPS